MRKIIIFDLYDTIFKDISFDFENGVQYLYDSYFKSVCSYKELRDYSKSFIPLYDNRNETNQEICLIKDELPLYFQKFNIDFQCDRDHLEYTFLKKMHQTTLLDSVKNTLASLYQSKWEMYIISNSIFQSHCHEKLLREYDISHYFNHVYSSADYRIRKPDARFFEYAIQDILKETSDTKIGDIYFVGNDYTADIIGSYKYGLKPIWYNIHHLANTQNLNIHIIDDFQKILEII